MLSCTHHLQSARKSSTSAPPFFLALQPIELSPGTGPRVLVLQRIINVGDVVASDDERLVRSDLSTLTRDQCSVTLKIYQLSRADLAGNTLDDLSASPAATRWVPHDGNPKRVSRVIPPTATKMELQLTLPPVPTTAERDNRTIKVWAKFGNTELTVRAEVLVGGVVVPEHSRQIPIQVVYDSVPVPPVPVAP